MDSQKINEQRTVDPGDRAFLFGRPLYVLYVYKSISPGNLLFIDKKGKSARLTRALFFIRMGFLIWIPGGDTSTRLLYPDLHKI